MTTDTDNTEVTEAIESTEIPIRVLKVATTSSLSNRSTLGYAIGCDENNAIFFNIRSNSAAGMFSNIYVAFLDIANALVHADKIRFFVVLCGSCIEK